MNTINCARCKHNKDKNEFISIRGGQTKYCQYCRNMAVQHSKKKCEHGKRKYRCIDCDGKGICIHQKHKENCKECMGSRICEHKKDKWRCKECQGIIKEKYVIQDLKDQFRIRWKEEGVLG
jgi:hypothetical protein